MKKLLLPLLCVFLLIGCKASNEIDYKQVFTKIVSNCPKELVDFYNEEKEGNFDATEHANKYIDYLTKEYGDYFTENALNSLINKGTLTKLQDYLFKTDKTIKTGEITITESKDAYYDFVVKYKLDQGEKEFKGSFQVKEEKISYFNITNYGIDFNE